MKDYYEILGVSKTASQEEISKAYRSLALKFHPDKCPDDPDAMKSFKEIGLAYETLSDLKKRQSYDQFGVAGNGHHTHHVNPFDIFGDMFGDIFNQEGFHSGGTDVLTTLNISLKEAYGGCEKTIQSVIHESCSSCRGSGVSKWTECNACNGSGRVERQQGPIHISIGCARCKGNGKIPSVMCSSCSGSGKTPATKSDHLIQIPPGIETGIQMILRGKGESSHRGVNGNLICTIIVDSDPLFERDGINLYCVVPITYSQAILGYQLDLPLFSGKTCEVKIPAGIQSGTILRLKGLGMPAPARMGSNKFGDLLVSVRVESPANPTKEYQELVKKLAKLDDKQIYGKIAEFSDRLKNFN